MALAAKRGGRGRGRGCASICTILWAMASAAPTGTSTSAGRISGIPPAAVATTGRPKASAFSTTLPSPSVVDDSTNTLASAISASMRSTYPSRCTRSWSPRRAISPVSESRSLPSPAMTQWRSGRRANQCAVVLFGGECRGVHHQGSSRGNAQSPARVEGGESSCGLADRGDVDAVRDDDDGIARDAIGDQHALDRVGNRDDAIGAPPCAKAPGMERDAPCRDEPAAAPAPSPLGDRGGERQRMAVVHVNHVGLECRDGAPQVPPGARIQADSPGGPVHLRPGGRGAFGERAALFGDERLLDPRCAIELAAQEPDLILAAAPIPARVYLQHPHPSCALLYAGTFTTPARTRRRASSLKGF